MANTYNALEVTQMAINMEKRGHDYYMEAASKAQGVKEKEIFLHLAGEEKKHEELFTNLYKLLVDITGEDDNYLFDETISSFFRALVEQEVFADKNMNELANSWSPKNVLSEGINAEKNSVLFYSEILKGIDNPEVKNVLDIIIEEEKRHIVQLTNMMKEI